MTRDRTAVDYFDPFSEWLGRPSGRAPEDHYELLGLARFEPDSDLISHTADTLRAKIRKIRPGVHLAEWQRLLDRIEAAKICLSDPISKAAYDESIDTASHLVNVSAAPDVTWESPPPGEPDVSVSSEDVPERDGAVTDHAPQGTEAAPQFTEAPPVVGGTDPEDPADQRMREESPLPAIRPSRANGTGSRLVVQALLVSVVLLSAAIGLALFSRRGGDAQTAVHNQESDPIDREEPPGGASQTPPAEESPVESPPIVPDTTKPTDGAASPPTPTAAVSPPVPAPDPMPAPSPPEENPTPPLVNAVDPAKQEGFRRAVAAARTALASRDLENAGARISEAVSLAQTDQEVAEADEIEVLRAHVDAFWGSLREQVPRLESGSEFRVGEMMVVVVEAGADYVILRVTGQNRRYSILGMPHVLAAAMAEQLFTKSSNAKALRAAFLIAEPEGNADQARQLLREASQGGAEVDELLTELNRAK